MICGKKCFELKYHLSHYVQTQGCLMRAREKDRVVRGNDRIVIENDRVVIQIPFFDLKPLVREPNIQCNAGCKSSTVDCSDEGLSGGVSVP